jgi:Ca-activated chloride channel family protein
MIAFAFPFPAFADGIIVPDPPICDPGPCPPLPLPMEQLVVRYHHVTVKIVDQVAVTHVDQVFYNPNDWQIEGTYIFPIPADAAVSGFTLWVDGEPVEGKVLSAEEARQTYEQIVSSMRDPALLEYAGRGAVQARIFPILPQGERRVELEYSQALAAENGLVRYVYPLSTEKFSALPVESVTISVDVQASVPIRAVYSPSHEVGISRESDTHVAAGYEAYNVLPNTDFALYYSLGETEAFHVLSYRDPSDPADPDGFFLVLLAPRINTTNQIIPKDVILVLDRSGSMDGEKFMQAQEALRYILQHLNPEDRFNIITFSTGIEMCASGLRPASEANEKPVGG